MNFVSSVVIPAGSKRYIHSKNRVVIKSMWVAYTDFSALSKMNISVKVEFEYSFVEPKMILASNTHVSFDSGMVVPVSIARDLSGKARITLENLGADLNLNVYIYWDSVVESRLELYQRQSESAAADIATWPQWMQKNLSPTTTKLEPYQRKWLERFMVYET